MKIIWIEQTDGRTNEQTLAFLEVLLEPKHPPGDHQGPILIWSEGIFGGSGIVRAHHAGYR